MEKTEKVLYDELKLRVIAEYSLAEAIKDKIVPDYHIKVLYVPLDDKVKGAYKKLDRTDKSQCRALSWVIGDMDRKGKNANFMRLNRTRIFQRSISKIEATKAELIKHPDERILVFCGLVHVAESLGIPTHHGKSADKELFQDFVRGDVNKMAVVKIGGSGVTYKKLSRVIINSFDSNAESLAQKINRAMSMEYDNPTKQAEILILTSDDKVELNWLKKALEFFDKDKITYIESEKPVKFIACKESSQIFNYQRTNRMASVSEKKLEPETPLTRKYKKNHK
jgi:superfamily II DNA or RNA helicase